MEELTNILNNLLGLGTVFLQAVSILILYFIFTGRDNFFTKLVGKNFLFLGFLLTFSATLLSLFYSEVLGFAPCGLCWLQRVFLYPQVVLFGVAFLKKDSQISPYIIWLSFLGALVAIYQHLLQMGVAKIVPCASTLLEADCAERVLFELGYVTFPLMSFSLFVFLIVLALLGKKLSQR